MAPDGHMGWMLIIWRRPFAVGDRIQIGNHAGDVMDLTISRFTLAEIGNWVHADQITGRIVHIPTGKVFVEPLAVYKQGVARLHLERGCRPRHL